MSDRLPPYDLGVEESLLSGCLVGDREMLSEIISSTRADYFYKSAHKEIFQAIVDVSRGSETADLALVVVHLKDRDLLEKVGGASTVSSLLDNPWPMDIGKACKVVEEKYLLRRTIEKCNAIMKRCYNNGGDFDGTVQFFLDSANSITNASMAGDPVVSIKEACMESTDTYNTRYTNWVKHKKKITGIESGIKDLDTLLSGFQDGNLIIMAARPGMGKSALALNILKHAAHKGWGSAMFSLEMPTQQLIDRMVAMHTKIDGKKIRVGSLTEEEFLRSNDALGAIYNLPIFIDDRGGLTYSEISKILKQTVKKHPEVKFAIVDHLQLVRGTNPQNRNLELGEITSGFKALAKELRIPIILLSQLNRELERRPNPFKRPKLSDLRDSGSIEQDADDIIFIYRPSVYGDNQDPTDEKKVVHYTDQDCELIVGKQRQGPVGVINCMFFESIQRFEDKSHVVPSELYERKDLS